MNCSLPIFGVMSPVVYFIFLTIINFEHGDNEATAYSLVYFIVSSVWAVSTYLAASRILKKTFTITASGSSNLMLSAFVDFSIMLVILAISRLFYGHLRGLDLSKYCGFLILFSILLIGVRVLARLAYPK